MFEQPNNDHSSALRHAACHAALGLGARRRST